ncbi:hypothetical protein [Idiomarina abyssalis]|uniref:hypothetical protein n=1 Tax=Idiomarina abyssalis TaxID=86102 RepID=UPI001CD33E56|nr:hypothetical protein [Idiomarina abyssalis]
MNLKKWLCAVSSVLLMTGCSVSVDRYHVTADNQSKIKQLEEKFQVEEFTATTTDYKVMCRLANNVALTDGHSFESYIQEALVEELKMAEAYTENGGVIIKGHLNDTAVSSGMTDAHWTLDMTISNSEGESFDVRHKREYDASFAGGIACSRDMPSSLAPTVQELIGKIVSHPEFERLFLSAD